MEGMNLIKDKWTKSDFDEFEAWQKSLKGSENDCIWEQKIVNTKLECLARTSEKAKNTVKELKKGNYLSFLDGVKIKTHFDSLVYVYLINLIKDYEIYKKYLDKFVLTIDNWASTDTLKFTKISSENLESLSCEYLKSDKTFVRRVGVKIWFELIKRDGFVNKVFVLLDGLTEEKEYYVNMCGAWLLAECMTKYRDETIKYFDRSKTNDFIINKAISKCRDSYRISEEDKNLILKFKRKNAK